MRRFENNMNLISHNSKEVKRMPKHFEKNYQRKHLRNESRPQKPREDTYHYPLEKPIVDIYREINTDLWKETFGEDFLSFH